MIVTGQIKLPNSPLAIVVIALLLALVAPLVLIIVLVTIIFALAGAVVLAVASVFRPELRRKLATMWRVLQVLRNYRRQQQEPRVTVVDVEEVDRH
ncbi:MAG: hypothetical protein CL790_06385 [Chloroflexi bacterium]|nr:hypothetical protein [Chloroflexota bacterium]MBS32795.1 hypothetical protein [Verrucomicrobiales bacterium]HCU73595.1 hypothetical protein [Chloroflexota bacterium]